VKKPVVRRKPAALRPRRTPSPMTSALPEQPTASPPETSGETGA
jgi:hypothetical protein